MVTRRSPKVVTSSKPLLQSRTARNDYVEQFKAGFREWVASFCFIRVSGSFPRDPAGPRVWPDALRAALASLARRKVRGPLRASGICTHTPAFTPAEAGCLLAGQLHGAGKPEPLLTPSPPGVLPRAESGTPRALPGTSPGFSHPSGGPWAQEPTVSTPSFAQDWS